MDAQDVTIHLALCYKESLPILTISYKNNTDKDIYFLSYYTSVQNYPGFRLESALATFRDARGFLRDSLENKQYFIFLAKNGQISEEIDLSGFKILRGSYIFNISPEKVPDSIVTDFKKGFPVYTKLPEKINGYYLYSGPIRHNSIQVIF